MKQIFKKIKNKIIDKASDALSYPARMKGKAVEALATKDTNALKEVREYSKGIVIEPGSRMDQTIWQANQARERYKRKVK